ncbi:MAG: transcription antitermination factor NusB [Candidatus Latescibacteria bacterium]|nr:transcription antitermination factor NusB [Candidatus Latescibacterota bacterium]
MNKGFSERRKGREGALQALYWVESSGDPFEKAVQGVSEMAHLDGPSKVFAVRLGAEVLDRREGLDEMISEVAEHWDIKRLARVDRTVLRMALAEMLCFDDIPIKVSIDEAIELGRRFGGEESPGFINGILDAIVKKRGMLKDTSEGSAIGDPE